MRVCSSGDGQVLRHAEDLLGKKQRRRNQHDGANSDRLLEAELERKHQDRADATNDAHVDGRKHLPARKHAAKVRFLWSAFGLYTVALSFFLVLALVQHHWPTTTNSSSVLLLAVPANKEQPHLYYHRHNNLRHRRMGPGRDQDGREDNNKHATSYAQRHHTFSHNSKYSSGTHHYYYGNGYGFEQEESTKSEVHRRYIVSKTNLSDVWLCLLTTLG